MNSLSRIIAYDNSYSDIERKYPLDGSMTTKKVWKSMPALIMTSISTLLLVSVDSLVAGNFVGEDALASVSFFSPIESFIGAITANVSPEVTDMMYSYAIGMMIATPFGLISAIGTYQLQALGKMNVLMTFSIVEGGANILLDLLFTGLLNMGVAGVGFGTLCANILRCTCTVIYLKKKTDMYSFGDAKPNASDIKEIVSKGLPESASIFINAVVGYVFAQVLIIYYGDQGGKDLAKDICDGYMDKCAKSSKESTATLSAIDLTNFDQISKAFDDMMADIDDEMEGSEGRLALRVCFLR